MTAGGGAAPAPAGATVVVGAGVMGRWHAHALRRLGVGVAAVVDPRRGAAEALASRCGAAPFASLEECLAARPIRVAHVCTPEETHGDIVRAAIGAGCHVLVEKPLAAAAAETASLLDLADERGVLLSPVHQFPFQDGFRRAVERLPRLGELVRVSYTTCSAGLPGLDDRGRKLLLTGILPHPVSLLRRVAPAFDVGGLEILAADADEVVLAGRAGGMQVDVFVSLRGRPTRNELELFGTAGSAYVDLFGGYAAFESGRVSRLHKLDRPFRTGGGRSLAAAANLGRRALRAETAYPGLRELVAAFHAAARDGGGAPVDREEALAAAALVDAARSVAA